jgi:hypothetical protein
MVAVTTIWWKRWLEIGIDHERTAKVAFQQLVDGHDNSDNLLVDFDNSVVAVNSAAFAIEALDNDFVYRLPPKEWDKRPNQIQRLGDALRAGWPLDAFSATRLVSRITTRSTPRQGASNAHETRGSLTPVPLATLGKGRCLGLFHRESPSTSFDDLVSASRARLVIGTAPGEWVTERDRLRCGFETEGLARTEEPARI